MEDLLKQILFQMTFIKSDISQIKSDLSELKDDVSGVKKEVKMVNTRLDNVEKEIRGINTRLEDGMDADIKYLKVQQGDHAAILSAIKTASDLQKSDMDNHTLNISKLNENLTAIESKLMKSESAYNFLGETFKSFSK